MILLNTTFHVHNSVLNDFIDWVHDTYIKQAIDSQIFSSPILSRILADVDPEGTSFALQLKAENIETAQQWHDNDASKLKDDIFKKWGERILHFTTYMEIVER